MVCIHAQISCKGRVFPCNGKKMCQKVRKFRSEKNKFAKMFVHLQPKILSS